MKVRLKLWTSLLILSFVASSSVTTGFSLASFQAGTVPVQALSLTKTPFPDARGHWAEAAITEMYVKDIMKGYKDFSFRPNKPVTFLEAIVALSKMFKNNPDTADVKISTYLEEIINIPGWASGHVAIALKQGLLNYSEIQKISRQLPLVRQDAAVLAIRSLDLVEEAKSKKEAYLTFSDAPYISKEIAPYIQVICERKVMNGFPDGTFQPVRPITRAELSILLRNLAQQIPNVNSGEISGLVYSVNNTLKQITIMDFQGKTVVNTLSENFTVFFNDKDASIQDLVYGTYIRILVSKNDGYTLVLAKTSISGNPENTETMNLLSAPPNIQQWVEKNKNNEACLAAIFQNSIYILAARGGKMTSGYTVKIVQVTSSPDDKGIVYKVLIDSSDPAQGTIVMPVIEYPFALVKLNLPQGYVSSVIFYDRQNQIVGQVSPSTLY